jgi:diaminopimelate decarboxylase
MNRNVIINELAKSGSYFLYDLDALERHAKALCTGQAKVFFACKANPLGAILSTLNSAGLCFDVASKGELQQVLDCGIASEKIIMTGPAKTEALIRLGLENKISTFVIESPNQLMLLQKLAQDYTHKPSILLRLQLEWDINEKSMLGGNQITPFGMDLETARAILPQVKLPLLGFHVFQWGNILSPTKIKQVWENTIIECQKLTKDFQVLDVGGGLGIPYQTGSPLQWGTVEDIIKELQQAYGIKELWLEMGRYITGPYGEYITPVVDRKRTYGKDMLVLEGGINHIARSALVDEAFPAELARSSTASLKPFSLHGPLCTALDYLGDHQLPSDVAVNDVIVFKQTGAYGFTESMPFFLCHNLPGEAIIANGKLQIIRKPEAAMSWLK